MKARLMRKLVVHVLALMLIFAVHAAHAETLDDARNTAQALVGNQAELVKSEAEDGLYEFEFRDDAARYEVDIRSGDGAVIEFETSYFNVPKASELVLTEAEARAKAMAKYPDAEVTLAIAERDDDDGAVYEIFLTTSGAPATLTVNAETGDIRRIELYPAAAGALGADRIAEIVVSPLEALELSWEDNTYVYEGDTQVAEFEIDAFTGEIREWSND